MESYNIDAFDPEYAPDEVWDRFYSFYEQSFKVIFADFPLIAKETLINRLKNSVPHTDQFHWLCWSGKNIIGWGNLFMYKESHPAYTTNQHIAIVQVRIDQKYWQQGIGTQLLKQCVNKIKTMDRTVVQTQAIHDTGKKFCNKYGFSLALKAMINRLDLNTVDWEMIEQWQKEGPSRAEGVTIERFNEVSDKDIEEYCLLYTETDNQQPYGEIEQRDRETPASRRAWEEKIKKENGIWTTMISRERNGEISGMTEVFYYPDSPTRLDQNLTGVKDKYRGRGLGKWLKAEMLQWIKREYPKVKVIASRNATTNAPMLSINKRLGFREITSGGVYKTTIDDLVERLQMS